MRSLKKSKNKKIAFVLIIAAVIGVLSWVIFIKDSPPRGWVKRELPLNTYSIYTPADWKASKEKNFTYWEEPPIGNKAGYRIWFEGSVPLSAQKGGSTYRTVWVAILAKDGSVAKLIKSPFCTNDGASVYVFGGYYRCDSGKDPDLSHVIAVAIDATNYATNDNYYVLGGRKYDVRYVECWQGGIKYDFEQTCEQAVKTLKKLREF